MPSLKSAMKGTSLIIVPCLLFVLSGTGILIVYHALPDKQQSNLMVEIGKSFLQLGIVIAGGGILVPVLLRASDTRKSDAQALQLFREDLLSKLREVYQTTKRVRRSLRAAGLTTKHGRAPVTLRAESATAYRQHMETLNEAQLELETLKIDVASFPAAFTSGKKLAQILTEIESYIRSIGKEYEEYWPILRDNPGSLPFTDLHELCDLTGAFSSSRFSKVFAKGFREAIGLVQRDLLPVRYRPIERPAREQDLPAERLSALHGTSRGDG